ncbi:tetrapyrrole methylase [Lucifera butyrica]|uniref:Tetrapyrrole methylase n=1 Tax=Lucifera butyrica TaxID=1351585 RepID=A0A498R996_9FIRM|nr:precorrin-6y C5,15-methyltransferase (decarboxylating) subunit CbiE [Lucifera butyrica]VBB06842.1 tetrapyrrole methylase [Lucifera butyrica]
MEHKIIVVGIGPGSPDYLPPVSQRAIDRAAVLVGSARALAAFAAEVETYVIDRDIPAVLAFIRQKRQECEVVVLVSGDPGFYSLLAALRQEFPPEAVTVIPGISSLQLAFARLGEIWQDAVLVSLHGRKVNDGVLAYEANKKLGILTDREYNPRKISQLLLERGWPAAAKTWLCANLSYDTEEICAATLEQAAQLDGYNHCVMVVKG